MAKTLKEKKEEKVASVMREAKEGRLHSGKGGKIVKDRDQSVAIALNIASKVGKKKK